MKFSMTLAILVFFAVPASAMAATSEQETAFKKDIERALDWYARVAEQSQQGISKHGSVSVKKQDGFFQASIPNIEISGGNGFLLQVAELLINGRPGASEGEWLISASLPSSMTIIDASGSAVADLKIGKQKFSAVWIPAQDVFTSHDAEYSDIQVLPRGASPYQMKLTRLISALKLTPHGDGSWSGPHLLRAENLQAKVEKFGSSLSIEAKKLETGGRYERLSLSSAHEARDRARALLEAKKEKQGEAEIRRLTLEAARALKIFPDGLEGRLHFEGVSVYYDPGLTSDNPADVARAFNFSELLTLAKLQGLKQEKGTADLSLEIRGLKVVGIQEPLAGLIPETSNMDISFKEIPVLKLQGLLDDAFSLLASASAPEEKSEVSQKVKQTFSTIPSILAEAGTSVGVKELDLRGRDMGIALKGSFAAQVAAPLWINGRASLALTGLDEFLDKAKSISHDSPGMMAATAGMIPFQLMGRYEKGGEGQQSKRVYDFELRPEGKTLLNGLDLALPLKRAVPGTSGSPTPIGKPLPMPPRPSPDISSP